MKITAFILALLMVFSLTACTPKKGSTTNKNNKNNNTSDINGDSSDAAGNGSTDGSNANDTGNDSSMGSSGITGGPGNSGDDGKGAAGADGDASFSEEYTGDRRFYYAGRLYRITNETVDKDEVGGQLFSITDMVENDPAAEGEGFGLDLNTNIYKFKEENQYKELIVLIGEKYYKAEIVENDLIQSGTGNSGTDGSNSGGNTGSSGSGGGNTGSSGSGGGNNAGSGSGGSGN